LPRTTFDATKCTQFGIGGYSPELRHVTAGVLHLGGGGFGHLWQVVGTYVGDVLPSFGGTTAVRLLWAAHNVDQQMR
jgi:hypothetical protein